jgi:hypothetical protein
VKSSAMAQDAALRLRVGEIVEVRAADEILATLDAQGDLDGLPFMPEMLLYCGRRLRVHRSAHKTCDTITGQLVSRRMERCVHLEGARCDGAAHGGCQAGCLLFWKEAWLKRVEPERSGLLWRLLQPSVASRRSAPERVGNCTSAQLQRAAAPDGAGDGNPRYRCQPTQLLAASHPLPWWEPTQYLRDWVSGNWTLGALLRGVLLRLLARLVMLPRGFRVKRKAYNAVARLLGDVEWPYGVGALRGRTPSETLNLQPGELVKVKSHQEILATLNGSMNRGMGFSPEMVRYCGGVYRVRSRVEKIVDEKTGRMMQMKNDCIILEDVICRSECSSKRLYCPRSIYPFWREIWLRRFDGEPPAPASER